ncbi:MAG: lipocalin family protein [Myxococcales bacterium]
MNRVARPLSTAFLVSAFLSFFLGCATSTTSLLQLPPLQTVAKVDLNRYLGTWYEIASFPQSFQAGCTATTTNYALRPDGEIDVLNRCRKDRLDGEPKESSGRARVVDPTSNAKLEVSFFRPFWGDVLGHRPRRGLLLRGGRPPWPRLPVDPQPFAGDGGGDLPGHPQAAAGDELRDGPARAHAAAAFRKARLTVR